MTKVISDDCARRALQRIDESEGVRWLQESLFYCYSPLLGQPWILDSDVTVKPLYGKQEGAVVSYNPQKPGLVYCKIICGRPGYFILDTSCQL